MKIFDNPLFRIGDVVVGIFIFDIQWQIISKPAGVLSIGFVFILQLYLLCYLKYNLYLV